MLTFHPSPIHGQGGFALADIPQGTKILEYLGEKISKAESLRRCQAENWCIFSLGDQFDLDGNFNWNPARLLNHSCSPNCDAELMDGRIWIIARRAIQSGEEITFNYSYDLDSYREHPCHCGAKNCVGFIVAEEFFPHLSRMTDH